MWKEKTEEGAECTTKRERDNREILNEDGKMGERNMEEE
jgi:hypothetical protein